MTLGRSDKDVSDKLSQLTERLREEDVRESPQQVAIPLSSALKTIKEILKGGVKFSPQKLRELSDAMKILKATPKRALESVYDLDVGGKEVAPLFEKAPGTHGAWSYGRQITLRPWDYLSTIQMQKNVAKSGWYKLPESLAHEIGHETTERLLQKRGLTLGGEFGEYAREEGLWEGIAEYLGKHLAQKAKVPFTPKFGYGSYGETPELIFNVLEKMPSKNPYMNVYRFLEAEGTFLPVKELPKIRKEFSRVNLGRREVDRAVKEFQELLKSLKLRGE